MKKRYQLGWLLHLSATLGLVVGLTSAATAQVCDPNTVSGVVYRDYDASGSRGALEPGVGGLTVTVFDDSGQLASTSTGVDGTFVLGVANGVAVRVELTNLPAYLQSGAAAIGSHPAVTVVVAPVCTVDIAVANPAEHCEDVPDIAVPCYSNGDPLLGGSAGTQDALVTFPYDAFGLQFPGDPAQPDPTHIAFSSEIGPTWGLAWQRSSRTLFAAAHMKRHSGFGPLGTGGIYAIDLSGPPVISNFLDLQALPIFTGVDPHSGLPASVFVANNDPASWDPPGKIALGDMDISEDEQTLYVVNLAARTVLALPIGIPPTPPTASDIDSFPIPDPGCFDSSSGVAVAAPQDVRPFALDMHDGLLYVGVTCSAETSQLRADLHAYVLTLDPGSGVFSTVFDTALLYQKGKAYTNSTLPEQEFWNPWQPDPAPVLSIQDPIGFHRPVVFPQPLLADIEFDIDGTMLLAISDRIGHQTGNGNLGPDPSDPLTYEGMTGGDLLKACATPGGFVLEDNAACPGGPATAGAGNNQGPGGGEFYFQDTGRPDAQLHLETIIGGLAHLLGRGEVTAAVVAPINLTASGLRWFDNTLGTELRRYQVFPPSGPNNFGKQNGLGDLELLCEPAPIQIGDKVWLDGDGDGIQDPSEPGIVGVTVGLWQSGSLIDSTVTDSTGRFVFQVDANTDYELRIALTEVPGLVVAPVDQGTDLHDSDALVIGADAVVALSTGPAGTNDHTFDFGFRVGNSPPTCDAGGPYVAVCNGATAMIPLDGTGSSDPDGDPLTYTWTTTCPGGMFDDASGATPILTLDTAPGCIDCDVTLTVSDGSETVQCTSTVTIDDTTPPVVLALLEPIDPLPPTSASSATSVCSPATSHLFRAVCDASDACSTPTVSAVLRVEHIEVINGMCVTTEEVIPVDCGSEIEIELLAAPCPALPASSASSASSNGVPGIRGVHVQLEVTAVDACGNTATAIADAALSCDPGDPPPCCPVIAAPPPECENPCGRARRGSFDRR